MDNPKKLPVFDTVGKAISYSLKNVALMMRVSWLWAVIVIGATGVLVVAVAGSNGGASMWLGVGLVTIVYIIALYSVAVAWHRGLLLGETHGWFHLSFGSRELSYLGYALAVALISGSGILLGVVASFVGAALGVSQGAGAGVVAILALVGVLAMIMMISRLQLVLPGSAVGDRRMSLGKSFSLTTGNTWRITGGFLLIALLNGVVNLLSSGLDAGAETASTATIVLLAAVVLLASIVVGFITLSYMSFCYWFFVPPPEEGDLA
jgi:hypothetical protein